MTEENIIRELNIRFDEENNPEEEEEVNPNVPNMNLSTSSEDDEDAEDQIRTEEDEEAEDEDEDELEPLTDDEINFVREFYDEDGNEKTIREHLVGNHTIAHSPIYFEEVLPEYLIEFLERRVAEIEPEDWESGETGNEEEGGENPDSRQCEISWIPEIDWVSTIFNHYFHIANREIWEYDVTELESVQVTKYDKNHFYGWHSDYGTSGDKDLTRKLSMSIVLTDPEDYSGGKLQFIDYMGKVQSIPKERGTVVVFDSRTPHRVTPVLRGQRLSLVSWMTGPKLR